MQKQPKLSPSPPEAFRCLSTQVKWWMDEWARIGDWRDREKQQGNQVRIILQKRQTGHTVRHLLNMGKIPVPSLHQTSQSEEQQLGLCLEQAAKVTTSQLDHLSSVCAQWLWVFKIQSLLDSFSLLMCAVLLGPSVSSLWGLLDFYLLSLSPMTICPLFVKGTCEGIWVAMSLLRADCEGILTSWRVLSMHNRGKQWSIWWR